MNVLVTGSSGTIGTRLCETLLQKGYAVTGIDRRPNAWNPAIQKITTHIDLLGSENLQRTTCNVQPDIVVHLAANARVYDLVKDPLRALENMTTTFNVLEWTRQNAIGRFLFASSREAYGNIKSSRIAENAANIDNCESPYTASKIAGEALVHAYTRCYGLDHVILRFSNVYGMYDDSDRVIPLFLRRARKNEPLTIFGGEKCLDFTYIDDTVAGIIRACEKFEDAKNGTYNIASGEGTTIVHLAERVKELTHSSSDIAFAPSRTGEIVRFTADIGKAKETLGYAPQTSFEDGIRKTAEWYGNRP